MMKKIACFAGALALVAGSAFAQKTPAQTDSELLADQKEIRKDRRLVKGDRRELGNAGRRDDKKGAAAAGSSRKKDDAKPRRE